MTAADRLGAKIALVVAVRWEDVRHPFGDMDTVPLKRRDLFRIVGQQTNRAEPELAQHFRSRQINALIGVEAQLLIGIERVEPSVLQPVGPEFVDQPDAASLLREIEKHAVT